MNERSLIYHIKVDNELMINFINSDLTNINDNVKLRKIVNSEYIAYEVFDSLYNMKLQAEKYGTDTFVSYSNLKSKFKKSNSLYPDIYPLIINLQ